MGSWLSSRRHDHHDHKKPQRGKGGEISDKDRAILQLKLARDNLERFKKRVRCIASPTFTCACNRLTIIFRANKTQRAITSRPGSCWLPTKR